MTNAALPARCADCGLPALLPRCAGGYRPAPWRHWLKLEEKPCSGPGRNPEKPVVRRWQAPELVWLGKLGTDDSEDTLRTDIRSLYDHEDIAPEKIIADLDRLTQGDSRIIMSSLLHREGFDRATKYFAAAERLTPESIPARNCGSISLHHDRH